MKFSQIAFATLLASSCVGAAYAQEAIRVGILPSGKLDLITDVSGIRVGQVTKIEGDGKLVPGRGPVRTGVTVVIPNDDIWNRRVSAATLDLNGNGEMTGSHWIAESGFLEGPIALTNTMNVGRVDDGMVDWLLKRYPKLTDDDVPEPVVAECDDEELNDIAGRHVHASDVVRALDSAASGTFARGNVGAGTGMHLFDFKGGIGSSSRVLDGSHGGYTVGVLVNANTGSGQRARLRINGVPVGTSLRNEFLPVHPRTALLRETGRASDGSIIVVVATDAPLDARQIRTMLKRATLGLGNVGAASHTSSGDLFIGFSTTRIYPRHGAEKSSLALVADEPTMDALYDATIEATEAAIVDALASARTMTGVDGNTLYGLPVDRVRELVHPTAHP